MKFQLEIETDNAAFDGPEGRDFEVARILHVVTAKLIQGYDSGRCLDHNGNIVGEFKYVD